MLSDLSKNIIHNEATDHVKKVSKDIFEEKTNIETRIKNLRERLQKGELEDPEVIVALIIDQIEYQKQLDYACTSPYFVRCDIKFEESSKIETIYFGRFQFRRDLIYSWVAPAASIRFEKPGHFSYKLPDGGIRKGKLLRRDQFMILDKKILFMSSESIEYSRELIYQEYFSQKKASFILPEIVEQMEKAQDTIIRSHYFGSFLVSGVAGSGKTTLALHRVAYLVQSPETEKLFLPQNITVFVQDDKTKNYFSGLLPELGIYRVNITTFDAWAMKILEIENYKFIRRYGYNELEKDNLEHAKNNALVNIDSSFDIKDINKTLEKVYEKYIPAELKPLLKKQLKNKLLDRFDLTILLKLKYKREKTLFEKVEKFKKQNGKYIKKIEKNPINYSLILVDEAENYLKDQLSLIKTCINSKTNALIYVGDLVQQTSLWTIKNWNDINESFNEDRKVILQKVYRNTRQILEYIKSAGFNIEINSKLKEGKNVIEKVFSKKVDEIKFVKEIINSSKNSTIGILAKTEEYLLDYKKFASENIHVMTINEAQGVEFEKVILVGINKDLYNNEDIKDPIKKERMLVNHDLLYVALTRAINELYVFGDREIKEFI